MDCALYVIATPLGAIGDLSIRAREVLAGADLVVAEDSRRAGLLFERAGIASRGFITLHEHNEKQRIPAVLDALRQGRSVALISDAGTPLISDPGFLLVRECTQQDIRVIPVPGPCAPVAALMASGLPPCPFVFVGFLPRTSPARCLLFSHYAHTPATIIFFERKNRLLASLADAYSVLGVRQLCIARELTKVHEQYILGRLEDIENMNIPLYGEFTVLIGPAQKPDTSQRTPEEQVRSLLACDVNPGDKPGRRAKRLAAEVTGWTAKQVYALLHENGDSEKSRKDRSQQNRDGD